MTSMGIAAIRTPVRPYSVIKIILFDSYLYRSLSLPPAEKRDDDKTNDLTVIHICSIVFLVINILNMQTVLNPINLY